MKENIYKKYIKNKLKQFISSLSFSLLILLLLVLLCTHSVVTKKKRKKDRKSSSYTDKSGKDVI